MNPKYAFFLILIFFSPLTHAAVVESGKKSGDKIGAKTCMLVMSYHKGNEWNDGIEEGARKMLEGKCTLKIFYMDTKRNKDEAFAQAQALKAKKIIDKVNADVIIASDDNASRYLIMPYYRNAEIPVVFCAINWTAKKYGYPYTNVTGMIEVAPIQPLFEVVKKTLPEYATAVYLGADTFTAKKNYLRVRDVYRRQGVEVLHYPAKSMRDWEKLYKQAQARNFIILGSQAGINDWEPARAKRVVEKHGKTFSVSNHYSMSAYAMFSMGKIAQEHGEWAGEVAVAILQGLNPSRVPIQASRKWRTVVNQKLLDQAGIKLPPGYKSTESD